MKWKHCSYCPLDGTCENQDRGHECEMPIKKLLEENAKLKGLLKECKEFFEEENPKDFTVISERMDDLLTKINSAIGESEE